MGSERDSGRPYAGSGFRAGDLIHGGAVSTAVRAWYDKGRKPHGWAHARRVLRELFPEARANSIEAVVRIAREAVAVARLKERHGPEWAPPVRVIPDARRLLRDAERAHGEAE